MRRLFTLPVIAGVHATAWIIAAGSRFSLQADAPQFFFGFRINALLAQTLLAFVLYALPASGLALFAVVIFRMLRRAADRYRPAPVGQAICTSCGYDLRATPERCPECGKSREDPIARS